MLDLPSCSSEDMNTFEYYNAEKPDSIVIDMDAFSSATINNKDSNSNSNSINTTNANSRITKNLSRKGSQLQRGGALHDKDTIVPLLCSPKGPGPGPCTPEKHVVMTAVGSVDQVHHQITITASNMSGTTTTTTTTESKCLTRRNSFRRPSSWALDPKRVLLFFAALSSMGTMLLIYFTITFSKENVDDLTQ